MVIEFDKSVDEGSSNVRDGDNWRLHKTSLSRRDQSGDRQLGSKTGLMLHSPHVVKAVLQGLKEEYNPNEVVYPRSGSRYHNQEFSKNQATGQVDIRTRGLGIRGCLNLSKGCQFVTPLFTTYLKKGTFTPSLHTFCCI